LEHVLKKPLAAALITAAAVATMAVPAGAAVPHETPTTTLSCGPEVARVWDTSKHLAADNPCQSLWLRVAISTQNGYGKPIIVDVASGAHFNWAGKYAKKGKLYTFLEQDAQCGTPVVLRGSHGKESPSQTPCFPTGNH
jgi:hypothetical protein